MDTTFKNILICGAAVIFIYGFFAVVQLQTSQSKIRSAEESAAALGREDALELVRSGEIVLLAAAYGWGPTDIPGFDLDIYRDCLADDVKLTVFENYGDVSFAPKPEEHYRQLVESPKKTWIYAESFNTEMLRAIPDPANTECYLSDMI